MDPVPQEVINIDLKNIFITQVKKEFPPLVGIIFVLVSVRGQRAERCEGGGVTERKGVASAASRSHRSHANVHFRTNRSKSATQVSLAGTNTKNKGCALGTWPTLLRWGVRALTVLMSAAVQPWTQISLHAVKSDPRHVSTPLPLVRYIRGGTQESRLSFCINLKKKDDPAEAAANCYQSDR